MRYHTVLVAHLIVVVIAWTSPFWLDWRWVVVGSLIYIIVGSQLKYCFLTKAQFGSTKYGFYEYYLRKWGVSFSHYQFTILARYIFPILITLLAIGWQVGLGRQTYF